MGDMMQGTYPVALLYVNEDDAGLVVLLRVIAPYIVIACETRNSAAYSSQYDTAGEKVQRTIGVVGGGAALLEPLVLIR